MSDSANVYAESDQASSKGESKVESVNAESVNAESTSQVHQDGATEQVSMAAADTLADVKAILVMFGAILLMAVHTISGFSFDF